MAGEDEMYAAIDNQARSNQEDIMPQPQLNGVAYSNELSIEARKMLESITVLPPGYNLLRAANILISLATQGKPVVIEDGE